MHALSIPHIRIKFGVNKQDVGQFLFRCRFLEKEILLHASVYILQDLSAQVLVAADSLPWGLIDKTSIDERSMINLGQEAAYLFIIRQRIDS